MADRGPFAGYRENGMTLSASAAAVPDRKLSLLEVRDSAYEHGQPWFSWVVIDAATNEIVCYSRHRRAAEDLLHRYAESE